MKLKKVILKYYSYKKEYNYNCSNCNYYYFRSLKYVYKNKEFCNKDCLWSYLLNKGNYSQLLLDDIILDKNRSIELYSII